MTLIHGYAKDHRPELKQAVLELMVSQDGGVPFGSQSWDGHTSDPPMFQERAAALIATLQRSPAPRYLVADAKLYHPDHAAHLSTLGFLTRLPQTRKAVSQVRTQALQWDMWPWLDETTRDQRLELCHDRMAQRGRVVSAQAALARAEAQVNTAGQREAALLEKPLFHRQAQRVETPEAAHVALAALAKPGPYHHVEASPRMEHPHAARPGRPTSTTPMTSIGWQMPGQVRPDQEPIEHRRQHQACGVLGTHMEASQLSDPEVIRADKSQAQAAGGFRFLKDPLFWVSSLLLKKPCRIQGRLRVLTFAVLVYAVTPRRWRQP